MSETTYGDNEIIWGKFGINPDEIIQPDDIEPIGDWKIFSKLNVNRPKDLSTVTNKEAVEILDTANSWVRRVAGINDGLKEEYNCLSEKLEGLRTKIENGELTVEQALKQLDGDDESSDKIKEL